MRAPVAVLLFVAAALAGCASESAPDPSDNAVDRESFQLQAGKGAIAGLLVDDRFRPIHLTDQPETEFQADGFILLQETGQQVQTTENGEFTFVDLEPGTYTLRVTADGHEAVPQKVSVSADLFNEISVVARRVASEGSTIVTEAFTFFMACTTNLLTYSIQVNCLNDRSGDSSRGGISRNFSTFQDLTWIVGEVKFNQPSAEGGAWDITYRESTYYDYTDAVGFYPETYLKNHLINGGLTPDPVPIGTEFHPWNQTDVLNILIFERGYGAEPVRQAYSPVYENVGRDAPCHSVQLGLCVQNNSNRRGVGGSFGIKAELILSIFIGEPEVDPLEYCVLCE